MAVTKIKLEWGHLAVLRFCRDGGRFIPRNDHQAWRYAIECIDFGLLKADCMDRNRARYTLTTQGTQVLADSERAS